MSYNISAWKIRSLHLELPQDFDFQAWVEGQPERDERRDKNYGILWCKEKEESLHVAINAAEQTWELDLLNQSLSGTIADGKLLVTDLDCRSDFSGYIYSDILLPLFKEFSGDIDAIVVWEGGDSIRHLTIQNGVIREEKIE